MGEVHKINMTTRDEPLSRILDTAARVKNVKINSDEQDAIIAQEVRSALTSTVVF